MDTSWWPEIADGAGSKHQALGRSIRGAIADGRIAAGDRLPPVREVAWRLGVTPGTVARAYKDLVDQGTLSAVVGRGTFVAGVEAPTPDEAEAYPYLMESHPPDELNLRTAQVPDVGQGAAFHRLLCALPPPQPGDYVSYPTHDGEAPLRRVLAEWFSGPDHGEIAPEDVVPTSGGQHALVTVMMALLHGPRPMVLTEDLAYPGIRHAAGLLRAGIAGVAFDAEGPIPEALDRAAAETGAQVFVTSAGAQNPTTIHTSPARRRAVVEVARRHGMQIVDDDCFGLAERDDPSYRLLAPERGWVVASLSKTLSPDLRVGAILAPPGRAAPARNAAQQQVFGLARPLCDLVVAAMTSGVAQEVADRVREVAERRVEITREVLGPHGIVLRDHVPFGWLRMPRGWRASLFMRAAEGRGIRLKAADEHALVDGRAPNAVRLALTAVRDEGEFRGALRTLARLLDEPPNEFEA